jgi:type VI secretion system protein ImpK
MSDLTTDKQLGADDLTVYNGGSGPGPGMESLTGATASTRAQDLEAQKNQSAQSHSLDTYSASINPLVAAAAHVLSAVAGLKNLDKKASLEILHSTLLTDLRAYQAHAEKLGAERHLLNDASYVLCTFVDEAVLQTEASKASNWSKNTLLNALHHKTSGGETFFEILTSHSMNPVKHLHLLELMYLCMALGFRGKYGVDGQEKAELEDIRDGVYRTIRHLRGDVPRELSPHWHGLQDKRRNLVRIVPWWLVLLFTLMCLAVMYSGFAWVLSEQRETVLEPYRQLDAAMTQTPSQDRDAR